MVQFKTIVLAQMIAVSSVAASWAQSGGAVRVVDLRCEYQTDPLGIDVTQPRLSWELQSQQRGQRQTAYQVLVATDEALLAEGKADLWETGKVVSDQSVHVVYAGKPLASRTCCYWKVRVWDKDDQACDFSKTAQWEMALLDEADWKARWIHDGKANPKNDEDFYKEDPAPLFRKAFELAKAVKKARLYITGLGYYEAHLNGQHLGDSSLDPAWTAYSKRVFYSVHDVTDLLLDGNNSLAVTLGNGWYNPLPLRMWGHLNLREHLTIGRPRFIAQLEIELDDGSRTTIISDETWKVTQGPVLRNNIYLGEVYDARREVSGWDQPDCQDADWAHAAIATEPIGRLQAEPLPPIRLTATVRTVKITEPQKGTFIFDMGQNFAGWPMLAVYVPAGTQITLRYGELLNKDGSLNPMTSVCGQIKRASAGGPGAPEIAWQSDTYIAKGKGIEVYMPRFTFRAFRYVEMTGYPGTPTLATLEGLRLNTDVAEVGRFECSNELFNRIQTMCQWTFLSNIFSVQSDCPHRERFGYGGDLVATCDSFMLNFDMSRFYAKAAQDWQDNALADGMLTDTAPFVGIQYCGVAWAMAHPLLQQQLYQYYGDRRLVEEQYAASKRWFDLVAGRTPDHIIKEGLSDHEALVPAPAPEMVTPLYCESARLLSRLARILGREQEARAYADLAETIKKAYQDKFFTEQIGRVPPGTQASQSFALQLDMLHEPQQPLALQYLVDQITKRDGGRLTTGIFGTRYLLEVLSRNGQASLAYDLVNRKEFPGWGHMLENGATTLWEHWEFSDNTYSHNHPMFGSVSQWFFNWLGGIQADPKAVGFDRIVIRPQIVGDLTWVRCGYDSVRGLIISKWRRDGETLHLDVTIPVGTTATVYLPAKDTAEVTESDKPVAQAIGVRPLGRENGAMTLEIESGSYTFTVKNREEQR
ncbi:MAG: family 78 glycoside hydrolase catalytic domain [Phycisphaerae bacterium]|nr:family 78 glycoside hydrolase catalytic domain [Phycisphaerae bacterium]